MIRAVLILVLGTLVLSAALTPWVYSALELLLEEVPWPYSRVFNRVVMVCVLVFVLLLNRHFPLHALKSELSRGRARTRILQLAVAILLTVSVSLAFLAIIVDGETLSWRTELWTRLLRKAPRVLVGAALIALIEESFFRVIVLDSLRRTYSTLTSAFVCSLIYSAVHFIQSAESFEYSGDPWAGFAYLVAVLERTLQPDVGRAALGLLLVGLVLCFAKIRSGSLYWCLGLHAGWIIAMKVAHYGSHATDRAFSQTGIDRQFYLVSRPLGWVSVVGVFVLLAVILRLVGDVSSGEAEGNRTDHGKELGQT